MDEKQVWRNIRLYGVYQLFREHMFWGPVLIIFINKIGNMSLSHIFVCEAITLLVLTFLEIPSGAFADLVGRKRSVVIGLSLELVSVFFFAIAGSPLFIWLGNLSWAVGLSLVSGADQALVYDSLAELNYSKEEQDKVYKKVHGRAISNRYFVTGFCSLFAGVLYEINPRLPVLMSVPTHLVAFVAAMMFFEAKRGRFSKEGHVSMMKLSLLFVANNKIIKWIIWFFVILTVSSKIWFFTYNPYFELAELNIKYFGFIFFLLNMVTFVFSRWSWWFEKKVGEEMAVKLLPAFIVVPVVLMGVFVTKASCFLVLLQNVQRGFIAPFMSGFLQKHLDSENRATVISIKSAAGGVGQFVSMMVFALVIKKMSLPASLLVVGAVTGLLAIKFINDYLRDVKTGD